MISQIPGVTPPEARPPLSGHRPDNDTDSFPTRRDSIVHASWVQSHLVFLCLAVGVLVPGVLQVFHGPDDHDVSWYLYVAGRVIDGAKLYVDLVEVNPPLIVVLSMPAVLIARALGVSDILTFELSVVALLVISIALCAAVLRRIMPPGDVLARRFLILLMLFALFAVPGTSNVFGQREHIMLILLLPYLFAAAARAMQLPLGSGISLLTGLLAGLGIALKPYFVLPWIFVEVYLALRQGVMRAWLRPENIVIGCVLASYGIAVVIATPEYFDVTKLAMEAYRDFFPVPYAEMLLSNRGRYVSLACLAILLTSSDDRDRELRTVLLVATAGFIGAVLVQRKGWEYHFYPSVATATLLLGIALHDAIRSGTTLAQRAGFAAAAFGLALIGADVRYQVMLLVDPPANPPYMTHLSPQMTRLMKDHASGESVFALSGSPFPMFPAVNHSGVRWAGRFHHMWALQGLYLGLRMSGSPLRYRRPEEMGRAEQFVHDAVVSDLLRDPPRLLFVLTQPDPTLPHPDFDYVAYFSQDARFAHLMNDYETLGRVGDFQVYKRMSGLHETHPRDERSRR